MTAEGTELEVMSAMTTDYLSKSVLSRNLGKSVDDILAALVKKGFVEGISLSGVEQDHFKLTESGRRFVEREFKLRRQNSGLPGDGRSRARILIVDDEPDITDLLKLGLVRHGFQVEAYNDPAEALANIAPKKFDLAVFDIRMPEMNGFELFREFRKIDPSASVCFMTAFEIYLSEFKKMFPDIEPVAFFKKPFSIEYLVQQVERLMSESRKKPLLVGE
jgi:CheY-like chemotaxis protein